MSETVQKGIGAAFHIKGETRAMRDMFATLRNAGIQTIDPNDAHLTIVDCAETVTSVFSERDQIVLNKARARASAYLATMPTHELVLRPEEPRLEVFGRRLGIVVADAEFVLQVRSYVGEIFEEEAGIGLSHRDFRPHVSVGYKTRGASAASKRVKTQRIPRDLHVIGHDVSERTYIEDPSRQRSKQPYTNNRHRLRVA
jgi:hypothetical protein